MLATLLQVAAKASSRRQVKIQAVTRDADSSVAQKLATGALAAVVAAGALLPAPVMAADLALGKQVFEGEAPLSSSHVLQQLAHFATLSVDMDGL